MVGGAMWDAVLYRQSGLDGGWRPGGLLPEALLRSWRRDLLDLLAVVQVPPPAPPSSARAAVPGRGGTRFCRTRAERFPQSTEHRMLQRAIQAEHGAAFDVDTAWCLKSARRLVGMIFPEQRQQSRASEQHPL